MFAKRLLQKAMHHPQQNLQQGSLTPEDLDFRVVLHYGIPSSASVLAFDSIQRLLAIGTLDGRIKVIGGDNIEGLLISPKQLPYKNLEFLQNQGFLVGVSNENDIQVWDLEHRRVVCSLQWESNITAFSVINGTYYMYVGDEYGLMSVLKYEVEEGKLLQLPYHIPANSITEAAGISLPNHQSIVGVLPQPCTSGKRVLGTCVKMFIQSAKNCMSLTVLDSSHEPTVAQGMAAFIMIARVLIAYENGIIILWDVSETRVVLVRGHNDLQLEDEGVVGSPNEVSNGLPDGISDHEQEEKEISSLCWVSSSGSILAVGYIDGDIMLWNTSSAPLTKGQQAGVSPNNVVKLQLSSGKRRLPVIVLHWRSHNDNGGQLFVYGGDDIGSEEVLTVLSLEWSSGIETLKCIGRVDLTLNGSFADMILVPTAGATENNHSSVLFVLTNPGQLHVYDDVCLSALRSQPENKLSVPAMQFPVVIPTVDPDMTVSKFSFIPTGENSSQALSKIASAMKLQATPTLPAGMKWPVTGGVPNHLSPENTRVERVSIVGYQDGSVRIWDATYPVLSLIFVLETEEQGIEVAGANASVSALDFCPLTLSLAVGNECGLVRAYKLCGDSDETTFHFVTQTKHEVQVMRQGKGLQCIALFSLLNSPIRTLQYVNSAVKVAVGFECGRVAILDISSFSVLFLTDCVSGSSSPIISVDVKAFTAIHSLISSPKLAESKSMNNLAEEVAFILTRDAHVVVIDSISGNMISSWLLPRRKDSTAISMYVIEGSISAAELSNEKHTQLSSERSDAKNEPVQTNIPAGNNPQEVEHHTSDETSFSFERLLDSVVLLCCEDALHLYSLRSVIQGNDNTIHKVKLTKPCCWTTTFKKDKKVCGLIVLYQTGVIEVRSLPDLEVVEESSLMSILRWSFKASMDKTMSSSDNGQIMLANGCELAFISLLAGDNDFRIPESLPCLHDKVLAAAADAAISFSSNQKKKQGTAPGILGGIIKGLKGGKMGHPMDLSQIPKSKFTYLESIFSKFPFSDPSATTTTDDQEAVELNIDDIEIDEPVVVVSSSTQKGKNEKEIEREKLFQGATVDTKPRLRTPEEIIAKYRKAGDASSAAAHAKDKLLQRQEKLERISRRTEELQSGAEDFASMADELVKTLEGRKWWKI